MKKLNATLLRGCIFVFLFYVLSATALFYIAGDQFKYEDSPGNINSVQATTPVGEITKKFEIKQTFYSDIDEIRQFSLMFATYNRKNSGDITVTLYDTETNKVLYKERVDVSTLKDNSSVTFNITEPIKNVNGRELAIKLTTENLDKSNSVTVYYNDKEMFPDRKLLINNVEQIGTLCFSVSGVSTLFFGKHYLLISSIFGLFLLFYLMNLCMKDKRNKKSLGLNLIYSIRKYKFLLNQLVSRDFKSKYKRSVLGVVWSFLNPLLTITVQYIVFSNLFRFDIDNYIVYLLTGVVFFNFFSEATSQSMNAIVGNASLITKVYVPKYIYPISKVMSSTINLLFSTIPLMVVILVTGIKITPSFVLLPMGFLFIIIFSLGIGFILASIMVFFRDTQFLWGIIIMLWMYLTPIFYPESILPKNLLLIMDLNPLYHYIKFIRIIILEGVSPNPALYLYCFAFSIITLFIGAVFFKKSQDKFVLNM